MAPLSPRQMAARRRVEQALRVAAPALDLLLLVGDRVSRAVDRSEDEPLPAVRYPGAGRTLRRSAAE